MTTQELIEEFEGILDSANPDLDDDIVSDRKEWFIESLNQVAEAAKLSERKRIEEALPKYDAGQRTDIIPCRTQKYLRACGFNDCLASVHSILNPQSISTIPSKASTK